MIEVTGVSSLRLVRVCLALLVGEGQAVLAEKLAVQIEVPMASDLDACRPSAGEDVLNRLTGLGGPLLQIDLEAELSQLRQEGSLQRETGRSSTTIAKYPDLRVVLILMKGGSRMRQHRAEGRISIQQLKGRTRIHLDTSRKVDLCVGHLLVLDCGALHDVEALDESALLLTIFWRKADTSASESSTQQQLLDEEAKSRMKDEGGTSGCCGRGI